MGIEIVFNQDKTKQHVFDALETEIYKNLRPSYPKTVVRISTGSANGLDIRGLKSDIEKEKVMNTLQRVWEDDTWLN
ncbi:DinI-like family protein [Rosenbergiella nectarea]|uniref:DinI-like family protein n=1 Tax=Rosenbergiella nectarea TaxID=988801 RepID=UPI001F4EF715|nr:DinI-like family protein [Rosenbergiella nectarea]